MQAHGDVPAMLICDLSADIVSVNALTAALQLGMIVDVAAEWAKMHGELPPPTFYGKRGDKSDTTPGPHKTRIDYVLVNPVLWASIVENASQSWP